MAKKSLNSLLTKLRPLSVTMDVVKMKSAKILQSTDMIANEVVDGIIYFKRTSIRTRNMCPKNGPAISRWSQVQD